LVCPIDEYDRSKTINGIPREEALGIPDSSLRVISHCQMGDDWEFGFIDHPDHPENFLVSHSTNIMVQTASLHILSLATDGRMTPERFWNLAIRQRYSMSGDHYGLDGINYGEIPDAWDEDPLLVPGLSLEAIVKLESLGDVELVKKAIIDDGKFWVWMRPDSFPLNPTPLDDFAVPTILEPPSTSTPLSKIEQLPVKVLFQISTLLPLPSLLKFLSTSRHLRCMHLCFEPDRDALALKWIQTTGTWYLPVPQDKPSSDGRDAVIGWAYLRRCLQNGSMRNRRRIWEVAEQIEYLTNKTEMTKPTPWGLPWDD